MSKTAVPESVNGRLKIWLIIWWTSIIIHYLLGIGGIACSTMAAAQWPTPEWGRVAAIISAIFFAIIGFIRPEKIYLDFVRAWVLLSGAKSNYLHDRMTVDELLDLKTTLESQVIQRVEVQEALNSLQKRVPNPKPEGLKANS